MAQIAALLAEKGERFPTVVVERAGRVVAWGRRGRSLQPPGVRGRGGAFRLRRARGARRRGRAGGPGRAVPDLRRAGILEDRLGASSPRTPPACSSTSAAGSGWWACISATASSATNGATASSRRATSRLTDPGARRPAMDTTRVLFLCTSQLSRSQMAEGFLRARAGIAATSRARGREDVRASTGRRRDGRARHRHQPAQLEALRRAPVGSAGTISSPSATMPTSGAPSSRAPCSGCALVVRGPVARAGRPGAQLAVFRRVRDAIEARIAQWLPHLQGGDDTRMTVESRRRRHVRGAGLRPDRRASAVAALLPALLSPRGRSPTPRPAGSAASTTRPTRWWCRCSRRSPIASIPSASISAPVALTALAFRRVRVGRDRILVGARVPAP